MSSIVSKAVDEVWESVVGPAAQSLHWLKSVVFGEFADNRPLSALVADMLVSFLPGVVIVTSARDAVAIVLRLAQHPEKREEVLEWIVLIACLVAVAFPLAAAAAGTAAAGVGAIVAGIAGSEAAAALRAVILMLVKESGKLVEMVQFLNKFIKGDVLQFLRAIKFTQYEKDFVQAFQKITDKLIGVVQNLRTQLLGLSVMGAKLADHVDTVKDIVKKLAEWERKFYAVQEAGLKQIPKATAELQARLDKLLAQSRAKDAHVASAGVKAEKPAAAATVKQEVHDVAGKPLRGTEEGVPQAAPETPRKDTPDTPERPEANPNVKIEPAHEPTAEQLSGSHPEGEQPFGEGGSSQVYREGGNVRKVVKDEVAANGGNPAKITDEERDFIAKNTVETVNTLHEVMPDIVPQMSSPAFGEIVQPYAEGREIYRLKGAAQRTAKKAMQDAIGKAEDTLGLYDSWGHFPENDFILKIDTNSANFRFDAEGNITSWFDPISIVPPESRGVSSP